MFPATCPQPHHRETISRSTQKHIWLLKKQEKKQEKKPDISPGLIKCHTYRPLETRRGGTRLWQPLHQEQRHADLFTAEPNKNRGQRRFIMSHYRLENIKTISLLADTGLIWQHDTEQTHDFLWIERRYRTPDSASDDGKKHRTQLIRYKY